MLILLAWDDRVRTKLYAQSDELQESVKQAGIIDDPDMWILEQTEDISD